MREYSEVPREDQLKSEILTLSREALRVLTEDSDRAPFYEKVRVFRQSFGDSTWVSERKGLSDEDFAREVFQKAKEWIERA